MIRTTKPANYGWPYCYVPGFPYADWDYVGAGCSARGYYDCNNLVNNSPNNLTPPANTFVNGGLLDIPDATPRTLWWTYSANSPTTPFEDLFGGGAMAGPIYTYDAAQPVDDEVPGVLQQPLLLLRLDDGLGRDARRSTPTARSRTTSSSCRCTRSSSRWT